MKIKISVKNDIKEYTVNFVDFDAGALPLIECQDKTKRFFLYLAADREHAQREKVAYLQYLWRKRPNTVVNMFLPVFYGIPHWNRGEEWAGALSAEEWIEKRANDNPEDYYGMEYKVINATQDLVELLEFFPTVAFGDLS
jgi:hypothetical protein